MSPAQSFGVSIAPDLPADEREALLLTLRDDVDLQERTQRFYVDPQLVQAGWHVFVAIMKDVGVVAGGASAAITLAQKINEWRRNARQRGVTPQVRLERPNQPPLDLATAGDQEVQAWLQKPPEH